MDASKGQERLVRVWRACLECRKKKSKCDGREPTCSPCRTKGRDCEYPPTKDNAAITRQQESAFQTRCRQLDDLCFKADALIERLSSTIHQLDRHHQVCTSSTSAVEANKGDGTAILSPGPRHGTFQEMDLVGEDPSSASEADDEGDEQQEHGHLALDSYGKLRFLGGPCNTMLIDAVQSLLQLSQKRSGGDTGVSEGPGSTESRNSMSGSVADLPFFTPGLTWPRLPYLPSPEQLGRPPRYISDLLVDLFFKHIHYSFPVLDKASFLHQYQNMVSCSEPIQHPEFLSVLYATCACASSLLPQLPGNTTRFQGLDYYQKALLLHYTLNDQNSIDHVQCIALISLCCAGWNTLGAAWKFAGQAVKAAQDLGLHANLASDSSEDMGGIGREIRCRIWWCVYSLDRIISLCLGRPFSVDDVDCSAELPSPMADDDSGDQSSPDNPNGDDGFLTGFILTAQLCEIAGDIVRSAKARSNQRRSAFRVSTTKRIPMFDAELSLWLESVPKVIKLSPNSLDTGGTPHLAMYTISSFIYAGSVINLHGPRTMTVNTAFPSSVGPDAKVSVEHCIRAAKSCIRMADFIHAYVPPSHYLAFCVNQLGLSGIVLLRTSSIRPPSQEIVQDVEACISHLAELEIVWSGAARLKEILRELLRKASEDDLNWFYDGAVFAESGFDMNTMPDVPWMDLA